MSVSSCTDAGSLSKWDMMPRCIYLRMSGAGRRVEPPTSESAPPSSLCPNNRPPENHSQSARSFKWRGNSSFKSGNCKFQVVPSPLLLASLRMETDSRCPPPPLLPPYMTDLLLLPVPPLVFSKRGRSLFSMTSSYEEIVFLRSTLDLFLSLVSSSPAPYLRLTVLRVMVLGLEGRVCKSYLLCKSLEMRTDDKNMYMSSRAALFCKPKSSLR